jgi:MAP/microtubule affinity-regulating kinase
MPCINIIMLLCCHSSNRTPASPAVSNRQPFPRNVPSRSTFHSGQNRQRNHAATVGGYGPTSTPLQSQDTSSIGHSARTSFFSKLSSRFSKR